MLRDLQPYSCTHQHCETPEKLYASRHEWIEHELWAHRKIWQCSVHPNEEYSSPQSYEEHIRQHHADIAESHLPVLVSMAESTSSKTTRACPICYYDESVPSKLQNHIAFHLESIASFALPRNRDHADGKSEGGAGSHVAIMESCNSGDEDFESQSTISYHSEARANDGENAAEEEPLAPPPTRPAPPVPNSPRNSLPPGWVVEWDPESEHFYYVHFETDSTQWEFPEDETPLYPYLEPDSDNLMMAVHRAARSGNRAKLSRLLDFGVSIDSIDGLHRTPLHWAVIAQQQYTAELLIRKKCSIEAVESEGNTPLHLAAHRNDIQSLSLLVRSGARIDRYNNDGNTALHMAAKSGHFSAALLLLDAAAAVNACNINQETPLIISSTRGDEKLGNLFIRNGAEVNAKDSQGRNALHIAALLGHERFGRLLLKHGASVHEVDVLQRTALHIASLYGHHNISKLLLDKGADVAAQDNQGETPLQKAVSNKHTAMVSLLLDFGADPDKLDKDAKMACTLVSDEQANKPFDDSIPDLEALAQPDDSADGPDILFLRYRGNTYTLLFHSNTVQHGHVTIGDLKRHAAQELDVQNSLSVRLVYEGRVLGDDNATTKFEGLKPESEIACLLVDREENDVSFREVPSHSLWTSIPYLMSPLHTYSPSISVSKLLQAPDENTSGQSNSPRTTSPYPGAHLRALRDLTPERLGSITCKKGDFLDIIDGRFSSVWKASIPGKLGTGLVSPKDVEYLLDSDFALPSKKQNQEFSEEEAKILDLNPLVAGEPESELSKDLVLQWSNSDVLSYLRENNFSEEWIEAFQLLGIEGADFLSLTKVESGSYIEFEREIFPQLRREYKKSGLVWNVGREHNEAARLRGRIRSIKAQAQKNLGAAQLKFEEDETSQGKLIPAARAVRDVDASEPGSLSFMKGDIIKDIETVCGKWLGHAGAEAGYLNPNDVEVLPLDWQNIQDSSFEVSLPSSSNEETLFYARALIDNLSPEPAFLSFNNDDMILVTESKESRAWKGIVRGKSGFIHPDHVKRIPLDQVPQQEMPVTSLEPEPGGPPMQHTEHNLPNYVRALRDCQDQDESFLKFKKGDIINIVSDGLWGCWIGTLGGEKGLVDETCVEVFPVGGEKTSESPKPNHPQFRMAIKSVRNLDQERRASFPQSLRRSPS
jgi:ankyrin repeat protein